MKKVRAWLPRSGADDSDRRHVLE